MDPTSHVSMSILQKSRRPLLRLVHMRAYSKASFHLQLDFSLYWHPPLAYKAGQHKRFEAPTSAKAIFIARAGVF